MVDESYNTIKANILCLSPLHIGSGNVFTTLNYFYDKDDKKVYIISQEKLFEEIKKYSQDIDHFNNIINDFTKEVQRNINNTRLDYGVEQFLKKQLEIDPKIVAEEVISCKSLGDHKVDIYEFINSGGRRYIPGSSIKGAIRKAVMYSLILDNPKLEDKMIEIIDNAYYKDRNPDKNLSKLIFGSDPQRDLFKALIISDTTEISNNDIRQISAFDLLFGPTVSTIFLETVYFNEPIDFSIKIDKKTAEAEPIRFKGNLLELIINSCETFSKALIEYEIGQIEYYKDKSRVDLSFIETYYKKLEKINDSVKEKNSLIIKMGKGSGFYGTTIDLLLNEKYPDELYALREKFNIGRSKQQPYFNQRFPKTRLLEIDGNNNPRNPIGWAMIALK